MRVSFAVSRNDISPTLSRLAGSAQHPRKVFQAMGNVFKSITEGNFNSAGARLRPTPWPAKKDGSPATLKKSGLLWHSFHLTVTDTFAMLANPTPYAAAHQFGYEKRNLPVRPFFPVLNGKLTPEAEKLIGDAGKRALLADA